MKRLAALMLLPTLLAGACARHTDARQFSPEAPMALASLVSADNCGDLLPWIKSQALDQVTAYGLGQQPQMMKGAMPGAVGMAVEDRTAVSSAPPQPEGAPTTSGGSAGNTAETGTNNQVAGVDEGDVVKVDGDRAVILRDNSLTVIGLTPTLGKLGLVTIGASSDTSPGSPGSLLIAGSRAYVIAPQYSSTGAPTTTVTEVDISDPPTISGSTTVDGTVIASRLADGTVRIVVTSAQPANLGFLTPDRPSVEARALASNRATIEQSTIADWLPARIDATGTRTPLVDCSAVYHPAEFSGFGALTILSISDGLDSLTATSVMADGQTTYASSTAMYVATTRWQASRSTSPGSAPEDQKVTTDVHRFDISAAGPAVYQGSGRVPGTVINQYAMDEADGILRMATTEQASGAITPMPMQIDCPPDAKCVAPELAPAPIAPSSSRLTTLRLDGTALIEVGHLDGLGPTEQIQAVRFVGATAYVVTFRNTDPLFVIDLGDPASPKLLGELTSPGFSDYLHPVGEHLLLGIGVDGSAEGQINGAKVSVYDTTDRTAPNEVATWTAADASLRAGSDPHAFTWDGDRSLAIVIGSWHVGSEYRTGAIVFQLTGGNLSEVGRIARDPGVTRTLVHQGQLFAVSDGEITAHDPSTLDQIGSARF